MFQHTLNATVRRTVVLTNHELRQPGEFYRRQDLELWSATLESPHGILTKNGSMKHRRVFRKRLSRLPHLV